MAGKHMKKVQPPVVRVTYLMLNVCTFGVVQKMLIYLNAW